MQNLFKRKVELVFVINLILYLGHCFRLSGNLAYTLEKHIHKCTFLLDVQNTSEMYIIGRAMDVRCMSNLDIGCLRDVLRWLLDVRCFAGETNLLNVEAHSANLLPVS